MDTLVLLVILFAAAGTASLNCALRTMADPLDTAMRLAVAAGVLALPLLASTGLPSPESYPHAIASGVIGAVYWTLIGHAYRQGELGVVFPLAFGMVPGITLVGGALFLREVPSAVHLAVILAMVLGLALLSISGHGMVRRGAGVLPLCCGIALAVAGYTLVDGTGGRVSGNALAYAALTHVTNAIGVGILVLVRGRGRAFIGDGHDWKTATILGALTFLTYTAEIWSMSRAPIALVAALRETSVLFATALAIFWLRERVSPVRLAGAGVVGCGLILLKTM